MKCTNCGKNNAVSHYRYEINGEVTEAHLCADCARQLMPEREFAARSRELFGDMFGGDMLTDGFFGDSLFDRPMRGLMDGFFGRSGLGGFFGGLSPWSPLGTPRIEITFPGGEDSGRADSVSTGGQVDPELSRRREINALREQMRTAAEREDYEQAAKLRDKLRGLEGGSKA